MWTMSYGSSTIAFAHLAAFECGSQSQSEDPTNNAYLLHCSLGAQIIHVYWKQWNFEYVIADEWYYGVAIWITFFGIIGALGNALVAFTFMW